MDWIRYMVLSTIDEDGCTRTSGGALHPTPIARPLLGVDPDQPPLTHLKRDDRLSAVIFDVRGG
jgi:hypothetical protein